MSQQYCLSLTDEENRRFSQFAEEWKLSVQKAVKVLALRELDRLQAEGVKAYPSS